MDQAIREAMPTRQEIRDDQHEQAYRREQDQKSAERQMPQSQCHADARSSSARILRPSGNTRWDGYRTRTRERLAIAGTAPGQRGPGFDRLQPLSVSATETSSVFAKLRGCYGGALPRRRHGFRVRARRFGLNFGRWRIGPWSRSPSNRRAPDVMSRNQTRE